MVPDMTKLLKNFAGDDDCDSGDDFYPGQSCCG